VTVCDSTKLGYV